MLPLQVRRGAKAPMRYYRHRLTCFKFQGEEEHEVKSCPSRPRCGRYLHLGYEKAECPSKVGCNLCGEKGHVFGACPTSSSPDASADLETVPNPERQAQNLW